jgi:hypothetical protein
MQGNFFVFGAHQVIDDVGARCGPTAIAKPLGAGVAFDDRSWAVNPAISAVVLRDGVEVVLFDFFFLLKLLILVQSKASNKKYIQGSE